MAAVRRWLSDKLNPDSPEPVEKSATEDSPAPVDKRAELLSRAFNKPRNG